MAEEIKKITTRGRKPKTESSQVDTTDIELESKNDKDMIAKLMEQMAILQKQVEDSKKEKTDLQQLVEVLKSNETNSKKEEKNLPKKVKVVNLLSNTLNLSTMEGGMGRIFNFAEFGDIVTMKTTDLEDILSIPLYRKQAEQGFFYICDKDIVEDQDLEDEYKEIQDKKAIEMIMKLDNDACVDMFVGLNDTMRDSIAGKMAENIANGERLDRNRLADIQMRTTIDIEQMAKDLKDIKEKIKK